MAQQRHRHPLPPPGTAHAQHIHPTHLRVVADVMAAQGDPGNLVAIAGDEPQRRIEFGIGFIAVFPASQPFGFVAVNVAPVVLECLANGVVGIGQQSVAVGVAADQGDAFRPCGGGKGLIQISPVPDLWDT